MPFHLTFDVLMVTEKDNASAAGAPGLNPDGNVKPIKEGGRGRKK